MKKATILSIAALLIGVFSFAQEQLPDFSVYRAGNGRVVISWTHNYPVVQQISIQRSKDSLNYFKTIASMPDPSLQQNGFADTKAPGDSMFYRIFILFNGGNYTMTKSKRVAADTSGLADAYSSNRVNSTPITTNFLPAGFIQSTYVFSTPDRYIQIALPHDTKKYTLKFSDNNNQLLFEMKDIPERHFKLDRSNFYTAGFVNFELYGNGVLVEKNRLYIPKEF